MLFAILEIVQRGNRCQNVGFKQRMGSADVTPSVLQAGNCVSTLACSDMTYHVTSPHKNNQVNHQRFMFTAIPEAHIPVQVCPVLLPGPHTVVSHTQYS